MKTPFKDIQIGQHFHTGISHGLGINKEVIHMTVYEKIDKFHAKVIRADWAPRQLNNIQEFAPFTMVFLLDNPLNVCYYMGMLRRQ